jgi:hypothetical protein
VIGPTTQFISANAASFYVMNTESPSPAGDIGNHVIPKTIVLLTGILVLVATIIRLSARQIMKKLGIPDILLVISMVNLGYDGSDSRHS